MCKCIPIVQSIYHNIYTYVHVFTCMQNLIAPARTSHTGDALWHTMIYVAASNQSPALVFLRWSSSPDLNCFQMWNVRDNLAYGSQWEAWGVHCAGAEPVPAPLIDFHCYTVALSCPPFLPTLPCLLIVSTLEPQVWTWVIQYVEEYERRHTERH